MHSCAQGLETVLPVLQGYPDQQEKGFSHVSLKYDNQCFSSSSFTPKWLHADTAAQQRLTPRLVVRAALKGTEEVLSLKSLSR